MGINFESWPSAVYLGICGPICECKCARRTYFSKRYPVLALVLDRISCFGFATETAIAIDFPLSALSLVEIPTLIAAVKTIASNPARINHSATLSAVAERCACARHLGLSNQIRAIIHLFVTPAAAGTPQSPL